MAWCVRDCGRDFASLRSQTTKHAEKAFLNSGCGSQSFFSDGYAEKVFLNSGCGSQSFFSYGSTGWTYRGQTQGERPDGDGLLGNDKSGEWFEGRFENGFPSTGKGRLLWCGLIDSHARQTHLDALRTTFAEAYYEGSFQNFRFHGNGRLACSSTGLFFEGAFENGMPKDGRCLLKWAPAAQLFSPGSALAAGSTFEGQLKNFLYDGPGKMTFQEAWRSCEGTFSQGILVDGHGSLFWEQVRPSNSQQSWPRSQEKAVYRGHIRDSLCDGNGILTFTDGTVYEGQFSRGCRHGAGVERHRGGTYAGSWSIDKKHGPGTYTFDSGLTYDQLYEHGQLLISDRRPEAKPSNSIVIEIPDTSASSSVQLNDELITTLGVALVSVRQQLRQQTEECARLNAQLQESEAERSAAAQSASALQQQVNELGESLTTSRQDRQHLTDEVASLRTQLMETQRSRATALQYAAKFKLTAKDLNSNLAACQQALREQTAERDRLVAQRQETEAARTAAEHLAEKRRKQLQELHHERDSLRETLARQSIELRQLKDSKATFEQQLAETSARTQRWNVVEGVTPLSAVDGTPALKDLLRFAEDLRRSLNPTIDAIAAQLRENKKARRQCGVCLDRPKNIVFNCGHLVCSACAERLSTCPFCRAEITTRIQTFAK